MAELFENFWKLCLEIYELDPVKFILAPGLAWQATLKNTEVELDSLTDIDMLLMVEEDIRGEMQFIGMKKLIIHIWKIKIKIKNYDILIIEM